MWWGLRHTLAGAPVRGCAGDNPTLVILSPPLGGSEGPRGLHRQIREMDGSALILEDAARMQRLRNISD